VVYKKTRSRGKGWFIILSLNDLQTIEKLNKKQFPDKKEYYEFLMLEIQKHLVEINDLKENKDPHCVKEIIDLSVLTRLLALQEGANKTLFTQRFKKFKQKINANL
jgi:hypothetical protein